MECKHCQDSISKRQCSVCKEDIEDECMTCHKELKHNVIKIQNVHIVGGSRNLCSVDDDPDAYAPSWKADN